jgi:hypothetical protein
VRVCVREPTAQMATAGWFQVLILDHTGRCVRVRVLKPTVADGDGSRSVCCRSFEPPTGRRACVCITTVADGDGWLFLCAVDLYFSRCVCVCVCAEQRNADGDGWLALCCRSLLTPADVCVRVRGVRFMEQRSQIMRRLAGSCAVDLGFATRQVCVCVCVRVLVTT